MLVMLFAFAYLVAATTASLPLDSSTLIAILYGLVSAIALRFVPQKDGPMVLISYLSPIAVVALVVLFASGTAHFSWTTYIVDVLAAYGANQGLFQGAKVVAPKLVQ